MPNSNYALWGGRAFIVAALLIGFASIFGYGRYIRFHNRIEGLKANGELVALEDLCHRVERPEDDAKFYLRKIYKSAKAVELELSLDATASQTDSEAMAMLARFTSEHPNLFPMITLAAAAPEMSFDPNMTPEEYGQKPTEGLQGDAPLECMSVARVMRVLDWKCDVQIAQGDFDGAFDSAIEMIRLGKLCNHGSLVQILLGFAFQRSAFFRLAQISEQQSLSAEKLKVVYSLIAQNDFMKDYRGSLQFERATVSYAMINFDSSGSNSIATPAGWLSSQFKFGPAMVNGNDFLDCMEAAIVCSKLPLSNDCPAQPNGLFAAFTTYGDANLSDWWASMRMTIGTKIAECHALQIVLALDANPNSVDRDAWPVEYLISIGVPEAATIDPFTDQPMRIKRTNGKWNVYSCGRNRNNDGGSKSLDSGVSSMYRN